MKIAVIGGGGVRTPLLVNGLVRSDLPIAEVALYDIDEARLAVIGDLAARLVGRARGQVVKKVWKQDLTPVRTYHALPDCLSGADYVFLSIRVGGIEGRARDEAVTMAHGIVGQETVGPGGFAMAVRTIPAAVDYAAAIAHHAPGAWVVNFTNPVGIVTQAMRAGTRAKVVGICDTPTELFEEVAHALEVPSGECHFDYVGLNHLGWVREVYHRGEPQLHRLWSRPDLLRRVYRAPLFEPERLQALRLLPTEYLYYYYRPQEASAHLQQAGTSRGAVIHALNQQLFDDLARGDRDPVQVYERYLAARNAGYMQIESGAPAPLERSPWAELTGYDKIALATVRAIHFDTGAIIPLNVPNRGNLPELEPDDVIEAPCAVGANGPLALHVGPAPAQVRDLVEHVKRYERLTVQATLEGREPSRLVAALAANPLVPSPQVARDLVSAFGLS